MRFWEVVALAGAMLMAAGAADAQPRRILGSVCTAPPRVECRDGNCPRDAVLGLGQTTEPKSGRKFFLDYPCDLKPGEKVVFILSLHGAGGIDAVMRSYFPALDFKEKYRLVIATPGSGNANRIWSGATDDTVLQNIAEMVFAEFGKANIKSFWLAGHSQGGITSHRIVCNDYFKTRVDGLLSLSGGRIGPTELAPGFFDPPPGGVPAGGTPPPAQAPAGAARPPAPPPACDFSYIYAVGQHEIVGLPEASPWAAKYACGARVSRAEVVDDRPGYVAGAGQPRNAPYGRLARPGKAEVMVYPNCQGGRLVADVVRMDKGHTEGLEPKITEEILKLMVSAPGGKARS